jgi:hypothetical protein
MPTTKHTLMEMTTEDLSHQLQRGQLELAGWWTTTMSMYNATSDEATIRHHRSGHEHKEGSIPTSTM